MDFASGREEDAPGPAGSPLAGAWLEAACALAALVIPLAVTLTRSSVTTQWRDDLALVRGLAYAPAGSEGILSSCLIQLAALLPLGGRVLRASLVSALAASLAARLAYSLVRQLLLQSSSVSRLAAPLALVASLTATLSAAWQVEATSAGGATLTAALALAALLVGRTETTTTTKSYVLWAVCLGVTALENHLAALALGVALAVRELARGALPSLRQVALGLAALGSVLLIGLVPVTVRSLSGRAWLDLGYDLASAGLAAEPLPQSAPLTFELWFRDVGVVSLGLAVIGCAFGLFSARTRLAILPLCVWMALDVGAQITGRALADPARFATLRLLALLAVAALASLGTHTVALLLRRARLPFARPAGVLLLAVTASLVFTSSEESGLVAERAEHAAGEVWTDEVFEQLPPGSLVLIRSQTLAWRLWASRVVRGDRPDLVIVPLPLLERGTLAQRLLETEPALAPLMREMQVSGKPSEYALSSLADARPLFVEFDPKWDKRLGDHFLPGTFWMSFTPHSLANSDRFAALTAARGSFLRVLGSALDPAYRDATTLAVLGNQASAQALLLASIGDRGGLSEVLANLRRIDPAHAIVRTLEERAQKFPRGAIDVRDLMK